MKPLVVVLGAAGFVGSAVLQELGAQDVRVRAVSRRPATVPRHARARIEVCTADLTEPGAMAAAVAGADVVIHSLVHTAPATTWRLADGDAGAERINVGLVRDLVDVLDTTRRTSTAVLFTGSVSAAGPLADGAVYDGTQPDRPQGEYDRQKLAAENLLLEAGRAGVLRGVSLRLPTVFGHVPGSPARDKGIVSAMARRAVAGQPITMWHDGTVRRDLLHVRDVARAFTAALAHVDALADRRWILGTGHGAPLGEVFSTVAGLVAADTGEPPVPVLTVDPPAHAEARDFSSVTADSSAFRAVTGWHPREPLEDALRATVAAMTGGTPAPPGG